MPCFEQVLTIEPFLWHRKNVQKCTPFLLQHSASQVDAFDDKELLNIENVFHRKLVLYSSKQVPNNETSFCCNMIAPNIDAFYGERFIALKPSLAGTQYMFSIEVCFC